MGIHAILNVLEKSVATASSSMEKNAMMEIQTMGIDAVQPVELNFAAMEFISL